MRTYRERFPVTAQKLARRDDPQTSKIAAQMILPHIEKHADRILFALRKYGPQTIDELEIYTGLSSFQVARRLPEIQRSGRAEPMPGIHRLSRAGRPERVWRATQ